MVPWGQPRAAGSCACRIGEKGGRAGARGARAGEGEMGLSGQSLTTKEANAGSRPQRDLPLAV